MMKLMYMLILVVVLLYRNNVEGAINRFFPSNITESTCSGGYSWTMWFDENKIDSKSADFEDMSVILTRNPTTMCRLPIGIQAQSTNFVGGNWSGEWLRNQPNNTLTLLSFKSLLANGINFRVRYCCPTGTFIGTTTTTTTPMPLDSTTCGRQGITPRKISMGRIYGGTNAIPNSWPWMVYYQEEKPCGNRTCFGACGATLIDKDHVITAAHCIGTGIASNIKLTAGMHNRTASNESATRQVRRGQMVKIHPQYNGTTLVHDIAVVRVDQSFTFTPSVQPACLPGAEAQPNTTVIIAGWGAQIFAGTINDVLKQTYTKVIGNCDSWWTVVDDSRQICVADGVDGSSACQGDSGGPILSKVNGQYVVSGVASFVRICNTMGSGNAPNVYTRVAAYKAWIKSITG